MKVINAYQTLSPPSLPGELDLWLTADSATFEGPPLMGCPRAAWVYSLWDKEDLSLAFEVNSSKLQALAQEPEGEVWLDDGIEFPIDPHRDQMKEFLPDFSYHIDILNVGTTTVERLPT